MEVEEPEAESKAIRLYYYQGRFYRRTKDGKLSEEDTITLTGKFHSFEE